MLPARAVVVSVGCALLVQAASVQAAPDQKQQIVYNVRRKYQPVDSEAVFAYRWRQARDRFVAPVVVVAHGLAALSRKLREPGVKVGAGVALAVGIPVAFLPGAKELVIDGYTTMVDAVRPLVDWTQTHVSMRLAGALVAGWTLNSLNRLVRNRHDIEFADSFRREGFDSAINHTMSAVEEIAEENNK